MKRIQRKRSKGWKMPPNAVYVGRPTQYGNDFVVDVDGTAAECVAKYREHFIRPTLQVHGPAYFEPLRGKDLACWCPLDQPCHADVLIELFKEIKQ
ncbi:MAG: DUF4326 domain-containing protein [Caldilineaceae bacterium]|nr:DUF4326 domain-containing protein [Caldilineaceae bacterium]